MLCYLSGNPALHEVVGCSALYRSPVYASDSMLLEGVALSFLYEIGKTYWRISKFEKLAICIASG